MTAALAFAYVAVVAAANLMIAWLGPSAAPYVAAAMVGCVIVLRDRLHDAWAGRRLTVRMGALVAAGALVSAAVNAEAARIAVASAAAFAVSEAANAAVYEPLRRRGVGWLGRTNVGNVPNAALDSIVFIGLAFGGPLSLMLAQTAAKIAGGAVWTLLLRRRSQP